MKPSPAFSGACVGFLTPFCGAGDAGGSALPMELTWPLWQSAQTSAKMLSLESLAGGEAKGGEDLRASIPAIVRWGCDL